MQVAGGCMHRVLGSAIASPQLHPPRPAWHTWSPPPLHGTPGRCWLCLRTLLADFACGRCLRALLALGVGSLNPDAGSSIAVGRQHGDVDETVSCKVVEGERRDPSLKSLEPVRIEPRAQRVMHRTQRTMNEVWCLPLVLVGALSFLCRA